jgi:hypothetical protein
MLELRRQGMVANVYAVKENGATVGVLTRSRWRARAEAVLSGRRMALAKRGFLRPTFTLCEGRTVIAKVEQPSALRSRLQLRIDGREAVMRNRRWYCTTFVVESGRSIIGGIRRKGWLHQVTLVDLPASVPLAQRVFLGWIAIVRWDESEAH